MRLPQEIIRDKRDGRVLARKDIEAFIAGLASGAVTEGQAAAFAMAVFFRGMEIGERVDLTRAMAQSGLRMDWSELRLPGPVVGGALGRPTEARRSAASCASDAGQT